MVHAVGFTNSYAEEFRNNLVPQRNRALDAYMTRMVFPTNAKWFWNNQASPRRLDPVLNVRGITAQSNLAPLDVFKKAMAEARNSEARNASSSSSSRSSGPSSRSAEMKVFAKLILDKARGVGVQLPQGYAP
jgi:hypothetical protein